MVYERCKIYGPYLRDDGRKHIIAVHASGKKQTASYPKYLAEIHLGRYLNQYETVDHIDKDFRNNDLTNLRVVSRSLHGQQDAKRKLPMAFSCPQCEKRFELVGRKLSDAIQNRRKGRAGPFCGRSCAGKYSTGIQHHSSEALTVELIVPTYTTDKHTQSFQHESVG